MKTYEAVFILNERRVDDGGAAMAQDIVDHLTSLGGRVLDKTNMGRREFARPIKKQNTGIYLDFIFEISPDKVDQVSERYRLNPAVTRVAVMVYEGPPVEA